MNLYPYIYIENILWNQTQKKKFSTCKIEKDITEFSKDKHGKDGYTYNCKICRNKRYNDWAEENRDKVREKNRKHKDRRKEYYQSDKGVQSSRRAHLKRKYNMTLDEYNILLDKQIFILYLFTSLKIYISKIKFIFIFIFNFINYKRKINFCIYIIIKKIMISNLSIHYAFIIPSS